MRRRRAPPPPCAARSPEACATPRAPLRRAIASPLISRGRTRLRFKNSVALTSVSSAPHALSKALTLAAPRRPRPPGPSAAALLGDAWATFLSAETAAALERAWARVEEDRALLPDLIYPPRSDTLAAFELVEASKVRVVILGQDPYHGEKQAMGLAFSVPEGTRPPPSLVNVLKEAGAWPTAHGDLTSWTKQGVLLLNTCLTVRQGRPRSHARKGWEEFTDGVIRDLCSKRDGIVFLLWGRDARTKERLIDARAHHVLATGHPSPLATGGGFQGCGHFGKANELLRAAGSAPIDWTLPARACTAEAAVSISAAAS